MTQTSADAGRQPSSHRGPMKRSGRVRAGLAMCGVAAIAAGLGAQGTFAFWTDSGTVNTGSFTSGTLDITLDGKLAGATNNGGTTALNFTAAALLPGESVAFAFPVANAGTTPLTYTVAGTGSGDLAVAKGLQYSLTFGQAAVNSGTTEGGNRAGSCGTASTDTNTAVLTGTPNNFGTIPTAKSLAAGASESACIVVRFNSTADNALQNKTGSASFVFSAKQPGV